MKRNPILSSNRWSRLNHPITPALRLLLVVLCFALFACTLGPFLSPAKAVNAVQTPNEKLSQSALDQIRSLMEDKYKWTPTQRKIDSKLLDAIRLNRGEQIAPNLPLYRPALKIDADGKMLVDIAAKVTEKLLNQIKKAKGKIINSSEKYHTILARIPLDQIEFLASLPDVKFIDRAVEGHARSQFPHAMPALKLKRKPRSSSLKVPFIGAVTSDGDVAHAAATARAVLGVNGAGVKVGVISDSYNNNCGTCGAAVDIETGDLPGPGNPNGFTMPVTVLNDSNSTDEGRAMLQIVHDIAPGAQLYFATAKPNAVSFANNILALWANGCDIIIDDYGYPNESPFQDDIITQAVNTVAAEGVLYFSAAGNDGNLDNGTSGTWEGDYIQGDEYIELPAGNHRGYFHNFNAATHFNTIMDLNSDNPIQTGVDLFWSDALGQPTSDYDLYLFDSMGNLFDWSRSFHPVNPYEHIDGFLAVGQKLAIVNSSPVSGLPSSVRFLHLSTRGSRLAISTSGATYGHNCAVNAIGVASVNVATAGGGAFVGGSANPIETDSSDGPRHVFYNANGTPITPGNALSTGGAIRQKPDIAAADGVATTLNSTIPSLDFNPFFGTSAAVAHAGAIAALLKAYNPNLTSAQVRLILTSTALDIEAPGFDRNSGAGIVMAYHSLVNSCGFAMTLSAPSRFFPINGGDGSVNITVPTSCNWTAATNDNWITIVSADTGSGNGRVDFAVRENFTGSARQGTFNVGSQTLTVVQDAGLGEDCQYTIFPANTSLLASGGTGSIQVTADARCAWQAVTNVSWITSTSSNVGIGNGTVTYSVAPNTGVAGRKGTITIAGKSFSIKQQGG